MILMCCVTWLDELYDCLKAREFLFVDAFSPQVVSEMTHVHIYDPEIGILAAVLNF